MGKITKALQKATEERMQHIDRVMRIKEAEQIVVRKMKDSKVDPRLVAYFDPKSVVAEQYKILTTNLLSLGKNKPVRTIAITSSVHSEGKTVTALNLAITMARATQKPRILLIDADMRKGRLGKYLGIEEKAGLSEVLSGQAELGDALFNIDIEHLSFMTSGAVPALPAELLASERMKALLVEARSKFDYILIDTPPVIPVTDPVILGAQTDGVVMVIQAGRTQRGMVRRAAELLQQAHTRILGHVLTGIEYYVPEYIYRYL